MNNGQELFGWLHYMYQWQAINKVTKRQIIYWGLTIKNGDTCFGINSLSQPNILLTFVLYLICLKCLLISYWKWPFQIIIECVCPFPTRSDEILFQQLLNWVKTFNMKVSNKLFFLKVKIKASNFTLHGKIYKKKKKNPNMYVNMNKHHKLPDICKIWENCPFDIQFFCKHKG